MYPAVTLFLCFRSEIGRKIGELALEISSNKKYDKNRIDLFKSNLVIRGSSLRITSPREV
jgi:hypothetical protein